MESSISELKHQAFEAQVALKKARLDHILADEQQKHREEVCAATDPRGHMWQRDEQDRDYRTCQCCGRKEMLFEDSWDRASIYQ